MSKGKWILIIAGVLILGFIVLKTCTGMRDSGFMERYMGIGQGTYNWDWR